MNHKITDTVAIDTETELIAPGFQAPPIVCLQVRTCDVHALIHARLEERRALEQLESLLEPGAPWIIQGHNIAYDMAVIAAKWAHLLPAIFDAYEAGRIRCTIVREKLLDIAQGKRGRFYDLETCARRYPGVPPVNKANPWRLRYKELAAVPVDQWPSEAREYAMGDTSAQFILYLRQWERADAVSPDVFADECRQSAADFWLKLTAAWGVHTDVPAARRYYERKAIELQAIKGELIGAGLVRPNGTRDMKAARAAMVRACEAAELEIPRTDSGEVALDADSIDLSGDELLSKYAQFTSTNTLLARIERLFKGDKFPIQPRFDVLVNTGRTSCSQGDVKGDGPPPAYGFQLQNPPREPGVRECFVPRPGSWFVFCDYEGMELRTWASVCLWLLGNSRLAEVLVTGNDPHTDLASRLKGVSYAEGIAIRSGAFGAEAAEHFDGEFRQTAKIGNFGFPGGMGAKRLVVQARAQYGVIITLDRSYELRGSWLENWPEAPEYFQWINRQLSGSDSCSIQQLKSQRIRGDCTYCSAANTLFQGLAADVAKEAGFRIAKACYTEPASALYGSRLWNFAHDEFMLEVPANPFRATLAARAVQKIMVDTANRWMPELTGAHKASPAIAAHRWSKAAKTKVAKTGPYAGCLIPHEWKTDDGRE